MVAPTGYACPPPPPVWWIALVCPPLVWRVSDHLWRGRAWRGDVRADAWAAACVTLGHPHRNLAISLRPNPRASTPHSSADTHCPWACADDSGGRTHSETTRALPQRTTAYPPSLRLAFGHISRHRPPTARGLRRTGAPPPVPLTPPPPSATRSVCAQSATRTGVVASHLSCTSAAPLCGTVAHPPVAAAVVACI